MRTRTHAHAHAHARYRRRAAPQRRRRVDTARVPRAATAGRPPGIPTVSPLKRVCIRACPCLVFVFARLYHCRCPAGPDFPTWARASAALLTSPPRRPAGLSAGSGRNTGQNQTYWSKPEKLIQTRNQNQKFWSKSDKLVKTRYIGQNQIYWSKLDILIKTRNTGQNQTCWPRQLG